MTNTIHADKIGEMVNFINHITLVQGVLNTLMAKFQASVIFFHDFYKTFQDHGLNSGLSRSGNSNFYIPRLSMIFQTLYESWDNDLANIRQICTKTTARQRQDESRFRKNLVQRPPHNIFHSDSNQSINQQPCTSSLPLWSKLTTVHKLS